MVNRVIILCSSHVVNIVLWIKIVIRSLIQEELQVSNDRYHNQTTNYKPNKSH